MTRKTILSGILFASAVLHASSGFPATIDVGLDGSYEFTTIQEAIDFATNGDVVVVHDGVYSGVGNRDMSFQGKALTVRSANGPGVTIIDCEQQGRAFTFSTQEGSTSVLDGFTIRNGSSTVGGAIYISEYCSPVIRNNRLMGNNANVYGALIFTYNANPTITGNLIADNVAGTGGGGIRDAWFSNPAQGFFGVPIIANNVFVGNSASQGAALDFWWGQGLLVNNTIVQNTGADQIHGFYSYIRVINNIIALGTKGLYQSGSSFDMMRNCVFGNEYGNYVGVGSGTDIQVDPMFADADIRDFRLLSSSPCIDAGLSQPTYSAIYSYSPTVDFDGNPRFVDDPSVADTGSGSTPMIDIGAYEGGVSPIPEPATLAIWATLGGLGLIAARRRKHAA